MADRKPVLEKGSSSLAIPIPAPDASAGGSSSQLSSSPSSAPSLPLLDKDIKKKMEKIDKDREKKDKEREKEVEKEIEKMEKDRQDQMEKVEKEKEKQEREKEKEKNVFTGIMNQLNPDKILGKDDAKAFQQAQRTRLHELFGQIEKEFEILWEENADLRRRLEDVHVHKVAPKVSPSSGTGHGGSAPMRKESTLSARLNPLKKKEREAEWDLLTQFIGHRDGVWEISTAAWEKGAVAQFATASLDRTARLWTPDGSCPVYVYVAHKGSVNSVRFHPTNRIVCTASGDGTVHIWRIPKPEDRLSMQATQQQIFGSQQPPPQQQQAQSQPQTQVQKPWTPLLDSRDKSSPPALSGTISAESAPIPTNAPLERQPSWEPGSPDGVLPVIAAETDNSVMFGVVKISRPLVEYKHKGVVIAADWLSGGDRLVSGSWDHTVRLAATDTGRSIFDANIGFDSSSHYLTNVTTAHNMVSPLALSSSSDGCFRMWDFRADKPLVSVTAAHADSVTSASFAVDDNIVVTGSDDRSVKIWDRRNFKASKNTFRFSSGVNRFSISPISSYLAIPLDDSRTKVIDMNGRSLGRVRSEEKNAHKLMVSSTAWSMDESVLYTAGFDRSVVAWGRPSDLLSKKMTSATL